MEVGQLGHHGAFALQHVEMAIKHALEHVQIQYQLMGDLIAHLVVQTFRLATC